MLPRSMGWYSSRLKLTTLAKLRPSSRCMRTSSPYTPIGEEPVARPNTQRFPLAARSRIREAISRATCLEPSLELSKMTLCSFSKRVCSNWPAGLCFNGFDDFMVSISIFRDLLGQGYFYTVPHPDQDQAGQ